MEKQDIKSMTQEELRAFLVSLGEKPFRTAQIYQWMHEKLASSFDDMTNLPRYSGRSCRTRASMYRWKRYGCRFRRSMEPASTCSASRTAMSSRVS